MRRCVAFVAGAEIRRVLRAVSTACTNAASVCFPLLLRADTLVSVDVYDIRNATQWLSLVVRRRALSTSLIVGLHARCV